MRDRVDLPMCGIATFGRAELCIDLDKLPPDADVAVLGVPFDMGTVFRPGARLAPRALREASMLPARPLGAYSAERDMEYLQGVKIVDCGDSDMIQSEVEYCVRNVEEDVRTIASKGAMPLVLGGDHTVTIPVIRGLDGVGDFTIIHIDAHLDWTEGPAHIRIGQGNPMRRSSELPYVLPMVHIGLRGLGSSGASDFADAKKHGDEIIYAREIKKYGVEAALARIPQSRRYYITMDVDGFDPSVIPATGTPSVGGLDYYEVIDILEGVAKMGDIVGMDVVELAPNYDQNGASSIQIAQIILELLGYIFHEKKLREDSGSGK